jgi:hypothetical protein
LVGIKVGKARKKKKKNDPWYQVFPLTIILNHLPEDRHVEAGKDLYSVG